MSPTLPALYGAASLLVNSTVWIFGGGLNPQTNSIISIDVSKTWATSSPSFTNFPSDPNNTSSLSPRYYSSMALGADGSSLWIYGGVSNTTDLTDTKQMAAFDTIAKAWWPSQKLTPPADLPNVFAQSAVGDSKGVIYYYGGSTDLTDATISSFGSGLGLSKLDTHTSNFTQIDDTPGSPGPLAWHTATLVNQTHMYIIGGLQQDLPDSILVAAYDTTANKWSAPTGSKVQPSNLYGHTAVLTADNSKIIVFGGITSSKSYTNDVWTLDLVSNQWTKRNTTGTQPPAIAYHNAVIVNNQMVVMFGLSNNASNTVYVLDTTKWAWVTSLNPIPPSTNNGSSTSGSGSGSGSGSDPGMGPKPAVSVAGIAGIILAAIAVVSIVMLSLVQPRNRVKPL